MPAIPETRRCSDVSQHSTIPLIRTAHKSTISEIYATQFSNSYDGGMSARDEDLITWQQYLREGQIDGQGTSPPDHSSSGYTRTPDQDSAGQKSSTFITSALVESDGACESKNSPTASGGVRSISSTNTNTNERARSSTPPRPFKAGEAFEVPELEGKDPGSEQPVMSLEEYLEDEEESLAQERKEERELLSLQEYFDSERVGKEKRKEKGRRREGSVQAGDLWTADA